MLPGKFVVLNLLGPCPRNACINLEKAFKSIIQSSTMTSFAS